jgi:hypothetical protein
MEFSLKELRAAFDECREPGWDGYWAEAVRPETYEFANRFLLALPAGVLTPSVGAESDGHLTLEWYRDPSRVLSVSVSPEGDLHYAALLGNTSHSNGTEPFRGEVPGKILRLIGRLASA